MTMARSSRFCMCTLGNSPAFMSFESPDNEKANDREDGNVPWSRQPKVANFSFNTFSLSDNSVVNGCGLVGVASDACTYDRK